MQRRRENVRKRSCKKDRKREMSLLFTLMLQCSWLRRGRTRGPYHPICCPRLCVSQLISLTKSGIIFQLSFIPFLSLTFPLALSLCLSVFLSHSSAHTPPLYPHRCLEKRVLGTLGCAYSAHSVHEDVRKTGIKKCIK